MNHIYDFGREGMLDGQVSWSQNTIRAVLVDTTTYTANLETDQWLSSIPADARVSTSSPFTGKTVSAGVAGADITTFSTVTGPICTAVVIYRDTGTASTSRLIAYIDQANGLPVTPNGNDITIAWDTDTSKLIFKL